VPGDDHLGGTVSLQPAHRSESGFEASVVGLDGVVGVKFRPMQGWQDHLVDEAGVEAVPIGGDLEGKDPGSLERLGEEPACCLGIPTGREEHVDDLAEQEGDGVI
jgi:hypothetical protein